MPWTVLFHESFAAEVLAMEALLRRELLAHTELLRLHGPQLGRPAVDTLKGSRHANMKELRFGWQGGAWRVAFVFDSKRRAVLLAGGDKGGKDQRRFYRQLIRVADERLQTYLETLAEEEEQNGNGQESR
ncbi:MAG: type II toxin-antitoxin system RelE/ParE family toxin [Azoarcus sp.]|jgi:hypothetical protein|nr:type II toxin-antitoxin system RelE/ParE family toxin [Azoarcus sp.]